MPPALTRRVRYQVLRIGETPRPFVWGSQPVPRVGVRGGPHGDRDLGNLIMNLFQIHFLFQNIWFQYCHVYFNPTFLVQGERRKIWGMKKKFGMKYLGVSRTRSGWMRNCRKAFKSPWFKSPMSIWPRHVYVTNLVAKNAWTISPRNWNEPAHILSTVLLTTRQCICLRTNFRTYLILLTMGWETYKCG